MEDPIYDSIPHVKGISSQPSFQEAAEEYTEAFFSFDEEEVSLTSIPLTEEEQTLLGTPSEYLPEELHAERAALVARLSEEDPHFVDPF